MPAFTELTTSPRPGNRASASAVPSGIPITRATSVAVAETKSDSERIDQISRSPPVSSTTAWRSASARRSMCWQEYMLQQAS